MPNNQSRHERANEYLEQFAELLEETGLRSIENPMSEIRELPDPAGLEWEWLEELENRASPVKVSGVESSENRKVAISTILGWATAAMLGGATLFLVFSSDSKSNYSSQVAIAKIEKLIERGANEDDGIVIQSPIDGFVFMIEFAEGRSPQSSPDFGQNFQPVTNNFSATIPLKIESPNAVLFIVTETPAGEVCRRWINDAEIDEIEGVPQNLDSILNDLENTLREVGYLKTSKGMLQIGQD